MTEITEEWLEQMNRTMRAADVPPGQRPWRAWIELSNATNLPVDSNDPRVKKIFDWFEKNTKPGSQTVGPAFTGAFYFDGSFWPFIVPLAFGQVRVNLLRCLPKTPEALKREIVQDQATLDQLRAVWKQCSDYAYSGMELWRANNQGRFAPGSFYEGLMKSAARQLEGCVAMLLSTPVNHGAVQAARLASEMFLKSFLAAADGLDDAGARKVGHNLDAAIDRCIAVVSDADLLHAKAALSAFPPVSDRYDGTVHAMSDVWKCYHATQTIAGATARLLVDRLPNPKGGIKGHS